MGTNFQNLWDNFGQSRNNVRPAQDHDVLGKLDKEELTRMAKTLVIIFSSGAARIWSIYRIKVLSTPDVPFSTSAIKD